MNVWLKLSEKDLQLSAVVVVTLFFRGKRSRRDLKFFTRCRDASPRCLLEGEAGLIVGISIRASGTGVGRSMCARRTVGKHSR